MKKTLFVATALLCVPVLAGDGQVISRQDDGKERGGKWWIDASSGKRCVRWVDNGKDLFHYTERNADGTHRLVHGTNGKELVLIKDVVAGNQL